MPTNEKKIANFHPTCMMHQNKNDDNVSCAGDFGQVDESGSKDSIAGLALPWSFLQPGLDHNWVTRRREK
jgi:hypothetical protein